jgi:D-glycero-D-manno-heptose 1,7-bisphosphate phosphatase
MRHYGNSGNESAPGDAEVLVLLDRDGVLCKNMPAGMHGLANFKPVPGLHRAMQKLGKMGVRVGIITNQPDVSRGLLSVAELARVNKKVIDEAIAAGIRRSDFTVKVCPHTVEDRCSCRKPKAGLVEQVVGHFRLNPRSLKVYIVGDKFTDLEALENYYHETLKPLGISRDRIVTVFLNWRYGEQSEERTYMIVGNRKISQDIEARSLYSAVDSIAKREECRL